MKKSKFFWLGLIYCVFLLSTTEAVKGAETDITTLIPCLEEADIDLEACLDQADDAGDQCEDEVEDQQKSCKDEAYDAGDRCRDEAETPQACRHRQYMEKRICKEKADWQESRCDKHRYRNETTCSENFQKRVKACIDPSKDFCYTLVNRDDFNSCVTLETLKASEQNFYKPIRDVEWTTITIPLSEFEKDIERLETLERTASQ